MLILIVVILFVATRGRSNEMMYVTLLFVFLAIAFFTYGYWSSVSRGDGVWQYTGSHNLQHQQVSNPNYHFGTAINYKGHPKSKMHLVAPPKMGGARLEIYTLTDDGSTQSVNSNVPQSCQSQQSQQNRQRSSHSPSSHNHHHRHHHHRQHHPYQNHCPGNQKRVFAQHQQFEQIAMNHLNVNPDLKNNLFHSCESLLVDSMPTAKEKNLLPTPIRGGKSCIDLNCDDYDDEPVKCEVNLSRSASSYRHHSRKHYREGFAEVQLPLIKR